MLSVEELRKAVRSYIRLKSPGLYDTLDYVCKQYLGESLLTVLFSNPSRVLHALFQHYKSLDTAYFIMEYLLIRPILLNLNKLDVELNLLELMSKGSAGDEEFKRILRELGVKDI
ncbi:MAG: hypothetical protein QW369_00420 [Desulfurococcaceae archaeon]